MTNSELDRKCIKTAGQMTPVRVYKTEEISFLNIVHYVLKQTGCCVCQHARTDFSTPVEYVSLH